MRTALAIIDQHPPSPAAAKRRRPDARRWPEVEVSGGVTLERVGEIAALGVDYVSVGALTHSAPALDLSLELRELD
ncbi:MAG: nicotinate-nucleotide diphosphorylase (carboxylating), partial [Thermoanaerobaculia bacterium]|nr:nicotinate-nucleotide diphosphorylase (carboxylating) [Thermoanaerobaculia bacterium]